MAEDVKKLMEGDSLKATEGELPEDALEGAAGGYLTTRTGDYYEVISNPNPQPISGEDRAREYARRRSMN